MQNLVSTLMPEVDVLTFTGVTKNNETLLEDDNLRELGKNRLFMVKNGHSILKFLINKILQAVRKMFCNMKECQVSPESRGVDTEVDGQRSLAR